jgi:hypothetical protein
MNSVPTTIMAAENRTRQSNRCVIMGSFFFLGGFRIIAGSTGSTPNDWLGGPGESYI